MTQDKSITLRLMHTLNELFFTILTGDKEASRAAARQVRPLVYSRRENNKYETMKLIIDKAPETYATISEAFRQENFVMAISVMYFLHDREEKPDFLFPWFFQLLQHSNGNIRYAVVRMIENELGPLTYHIRYPGDTSNFSRMSPELANQILYGLHINLKNLATSSYKPVFKKYKYVDSLPSGTYKSVQHLLSYLDECYCENS